MVDDPQPFRLTFKGELGVVEILALSTAGAIVFSAAYYYGYYSNLESSFLLWLTVPDLLNGAAVAAIPTLLFVNAAIFLVYAAANRGWYLWLNVGLLLITGAILLYVYVVAGAFDFLGKFVYSVLLVGGLGFFIYAKLYNLKSIASMGGLAAMAYGGVSGIGDANYILDTTRYDRPTAVLITDGASYEGRLMGVTSQYVFLYNGATVSVLRLEDVRIVRMLNVEQH